MRFLFLVLYVFVLVEMRAQTNVTAPAFELSITLDTFGSTKSCIKGKFHGTLIIQQYRWGEWCNVDTLGLNQHWDDSCINAKIYVHSGLNQIRLQAVPTNPYQQPHYSVLAKAITRFECNTLGRCNSIQFNTSSYWEIRDSNNVVLRSGYSDIVNSTGLQKGSYYLYYDNKRMEFFKQ